MKNKGFKKIGIVSLSAIILLIAMITLIEFVAKSVRKEAKGTIDSELLRAMEYEVFDSNDDAVEETENVKFSSFFLRDIDGDGYAEKLKGTCKEIGSQDTLYMEINVLKEGYLENASIKIDGKNFYLQTALPKDNEIKNNYIGNNIKQIEFNTISSGSQKFVTGVVRSGDYTYESDKAKAIKNDTNKYSVNDNQIILTGTYVANDGTRTNINKAINLAVDWYGVTKAKIQKISQTRDIDGILDGENGVAKFNFEITTVEEKNELILSKVVSKANIPLLGEYSPISVEVIGENENFLYDEETRELIIIREATIDENGIVTKTVSRENTFKIRVTYPIEACYETQEDTEALLRVPVEAYYEGYNNQNQEFENPYRSDTVKSTILSRYRQPFGDRARVDVMVGQKVNNPTSRYIVSKDNAMKIYNGAEEENVSEYIVRWYITTGYQGIGSGMEIKENEYNKPQISDKFIKVDGTDESMEDLTSNVGIYFSNQLSLLGGNGQIKVYDDQTNELLVIFDASNWNNYSASNPYMYDKPVKHVRVVTSATNADASLSIYNVKQIDNVEITEKYTKEEFENLQYIHSSIAAYFQGDLLNTNSANANYEAPYSIAEISLSKETMSTQETEKNEIITIKTGKSTNNRIGEWKNGSFLIKLPSNIIDVELNNVTINNTDVNIISSEIIEKDNNYFIKINTENEIAVSYEMQVDVNLTSDPRLASSSGNVELYASNENVSDYYYKSADIYDVNDNLNLTEKVNITNKYINFVAPSSLLTNEVASNFDENGSIVIAPKIVEIDTNKEQTTADVGIQLKNNYGKSISEITILGKIPFEGNLYTISGQDMESSFTTKIKETGIIVPEELKNIIKIYYSENENPTQDINDSNNVWKEFNEVENWDNIKTFLIDFNEYTMNEGEEIIFNYTIIIPAGVDYNKVSYSHHGVYFTLDTENGKYRTQLEPNKLGFRIAKKYNLELTKYQADRDKLVSGATYSVTPEGSKESKTATTNAEGKLEIKNLYVEQIYTLKEIKTPIDYVLNREIIKFVAHVDEENNIFIEKIEGNTKESFKVVKEESENYRATVQVEDEVNGRLKLTKFEKDSTNRIQNAKFEIKGRGLPSAGVLITTDKNGEVEFSGLEVNQEYTLREMSVDGYYLTGTVKFMITNENKEYKLSIVQGEVKNSSIGELDSIPVVNLDLEDEKIPTYNLEITKIKKVSNLELNGNSQIAEGNQEEITYLEGAKFRLYKNNKEIGNFVTGADGKFIINDLYQYVDGKEEDAIYTLKETEAPAGYSKVKDITFKVKEVDGILKFESQDDIQRDYTSEGNILRLIIQDSPSFKLVKKDAETGARIPNVKFAIYEVENNGELPAKNGKGEIVGTKQTIDGKEYYIVQTDFNGEITVDLPEGFYKAVEVEAPEQYDISDSTYYFGVGSSKKGNEELEEIWGRMISVNSEDQLGSSIYQAYSLVAQFDNGEYIIGESRKITKYNNNNEQLWSKDIEIDPQTIVATNDGGIVAVGRLSVEKYDENGEKQWSKTFPTGGYIKAICETSDGGYLLGGTFSGSNLQLDNDIDVTLQGSKSIIIGLNSLGEAQWVKEIGNNYNDYIRKIVETSDGGFVVAGNMGSETIDLGNEIVLKRNGPDGMIIKYNSNREVQWAKTIGGEGKDEVMSLGVTNDDKIIVAGYLGSVETQLDDEIIINKGNQAPNGILIEYDLDGNIEWTKLLETEEAAAYITCVSITSNNEILIGGYAYASSFVIDGIELEGNYKGFIAQYTSDGNIKYAESVGYTYQSYYITSVMEAVDGDLFISGNYYGLIHIGEDTISGDTVIRYKWNEKQYVDIKDIEIIGVNQNSPYFDVIKATPDGGKIVVLRAIGDVYLENNTVIKVDSEQEWTGITIKYDEEGNVEWYKVNEEMIMELVVLPEEDGGYIATTYSKLIKYTLQGEKEWEKTIENLATMRFSINEEGEIVIIGDLENQSNESDTDTLLIKYSNEGEKLWTRRIGGDNSDSNVYVEATTDRGAIVTLQSRSGNVKIDETTTIENTKPNQYFVIKYNDLGEAEWWKEFDNSRKLLVKEVKSDEFIVHDFFAANTYLGNGITTGREGYGLVKYNAEGEAQWVKMLYGDNMYESGIIPTSDGGFALLENFVGIMQIKGYGKIVGNPWPSTAIIKFTSDGDVVWAKALKGDTVIYGMKLIENNNNQIEFCGFFYGTMYVDNGEDISSVGPKAFLVKIEEADVVSEKDELVIENKRKEFKILTQVEENDGVKGGTISGEEFEYYEKVSYGSSNKNEIKMIPDENYEIARVCINESEVQFKANDDGTYILPSIENITEDMNITVKYILKDNKFTLNKIDKDTKEPLEGAKFKIEEVDEREVPEDAIGKMTANGEMAESIIDYSAPIEGVLGVLTDDDECEYHFVEQDGKYIPTNGKTYQVLNGGNAGITKSTAGSYVKIDLTGKEGQYKVVVNARSSSETFDKGEARLVSNSGNETVSSRFMQISGTVADNDYISNIVLTGGEEYYIYFYYTKDSSTDKGEDQVVINSINVYSYLEKRYCFIENSGKYESNNQGAGGKTANSYMEIDLTGKTGKYDLTVNAETSGRYTDYSYATITQNTTAPKYNNSSGRFIYLTGSNLAKDYTTVLEGGQKYYLHFGYYKYSSSSQGEDKFTINSINIDLNNSDLYRTEVKTNSQGQAKLQLEYNKYKITEIEAPYGYELLEEPIIFEMKSGGDNDLVVENEKSVKVKVHHYLKNGDGEYTTIKVAEDEEIMGKIGDRYSSKPHMDLKEYQLEKDGQENYVIPLNATGIYTGEAVDIIYYYEEKIKNILTQNIEITSNTENIISRNQTVDYTIEYSAEVAKFIGNSKVIIIDRLPYYIDIQDEEMNLDGGIYNEENKTIIWEEEFSGIDTSEDEKFQIAITKQIRVKYLDIDNTQDAVDNIVTGNILLNDEEKIDPVVSNKNIPILVGSVQIKYLEKSTGKELAEQIVIKDFPGINYSAKSENIEGYTCIENTDNTTGIITQGVTDVIYYYAKNSKVLVNYLERQTNGVIAEPEEIAGYEGKEYETNKKEIEGYTFVTSTPNESGIMQKDDITVNYYYAKNAIATIKHIDKQTGKILLEEEIKGKVGDTIQTHSENFDGYVLVESPENQTIVMQEEQVIEYYYERISSGVIEKHIDIITNEIIFNQEHIGYKGETYNIEAKEFEGYDLVETDLPTNAEGIMAEEVIEVKYYYIKKVTVKVEYIDKLTNEKIDVVVIEGHENDEYTSEVKEFDDYILEGKPSNASGKMVVTLNDDGTYDREIEVKYYYLKKSAGVIEKHIDINSNKVLKEQKYTGLVGDEYTTSEMTFEGYQLVEERLPENATGTMQEDLIEVNYYYVKKSKVIIKYVEALTGEELVPQEEIEGIVGTEYEAITKEIQYYDMIDSTDNTSGIMQDEEIEVIYYYEKQIFNLKVDKWISNVTVDGVLKGGNTFETKENIYKLELDRKTILSTDVKVSYKIRVSNVGEIAGKIETLEEIIPKGFSYYQDDNNFNWNKIDNTLILSDLNNETLQPGENKEIDIVLRWSNGESNFGEKINTVNLSKTSNMAEYQESDEKDNTDKCSMLIAISTGAEENKTTIIVSILTITLIGVGILIVVLKKVRK